MILVGTRSLDTRSISSGLLIAETSTNGPFTWKGRAESHGIMLALNKVCCSVNLLHIYYLAMFWGFIDSM